MRRFLAFVGVLLVICGARLYDNGLLDCGYEGTFTVYDSLDNAKVYDSVPKFRLSNGDFTRVDFAGGSGDAIEVIGNLNATIKFKEEFGELTVIYAFSPDILSSRLVGGCKINIMVAFKDGHVSVGSPLLKGSY